MHDLPQLRFQFTARFAEPSERVNPVPPMDPAGFPDPLAPGFEYTPTLLLHGVGRESNVRVPPTLTTRSGLDLRTLTLAYGAEVVARDGPGGEPTVQIVDRRPSGQITLDMPSVADLALVNKAVEGDTGPFRLTHGNAAGNTVTLDMPALQLSSPSYSDDDGSWRVQTHFKALPVAGNDEIRLTVT